MPTPPKSRLREIAEKWDGGALAKSKAKDIPYDLTSGIPSSMPGAGDQYKDPEASSSPSALPAQPSPIKTLK